MKKTKKSKVLAILVALLVMVPTIVFAETEKLDKGDYVYFGEFYTNPILWRVIDFDSDGDPLLFSDKILTLRIFSHGDDWEKSDIRKWLNSEKNNEELIEGSEEGFLIDNNFTKNEKQAIKEVTQKLLISRFKKGTNKSFTPEENDITPDGGKYFYEQNWDKNILGGMNFEDVAEGYDESYYINVTDKMFLLSIKQAADVYFNFKNESSRAVGLYQNAPSFYLGYPTANARNDEKRTTILSQRSLTYPYWLRTSFEYKPFIVKHIYSSEQRDLNTFSTYTERGVRPAFYLKQGCMNIAKGDGSYDAPYVFDEKAEVN